jgi:Invasin, domain 3
MSAGRRRIAGMPALILLVAIAFTTAHAQGVRFGQNRIAITANPGRLPADGQTSSRIRVEVWDQSNNPVPDGTEVIISTDLGDFTGDTGARQPTLTLRLKSGYALVSLTSREPGTATVRVQCRDSRNQALVEFLPLGEAGKAQSTVVHIRGGWVGYWSDLTLLEARKAELRYRGLRLEADRLQLDPLTLVVRAYGVKLKRGDAIVEGEDIYLPLNAMKGVLRRFSEENGVEEISINAFTLKPSQTEERLPENAFRPDMREGRVLMVAKSISIFPGERLVLRSAALYVDDHKLMRYPPYWVMAFEGYQGSSNTNFLSFDSAGGLAVDFPIFFSVTDTSTGAVKIQRGATNGSVMVQHGWSLALEQTYQQPEQEAEGILTIAGVPRSNWGIAFRDTRKILDGADSSLGIAWPDHKSLFTDYSVFKFMRAGSLGARTHFDRDGRTGNVSYGLNADFYSNAIRLGRGASFRWGSAVEAGRNSLFDDGLVFQHQTSLFLDFTPWRPTTSTSIGPALGNTTTWDSAGRLSNIARAQLNLSQRVTRGVNFGLRYGVEYRSGETRYGALDSLQGLDQQVSLNLSAYPSRRWDALLSANYDVTDGDIYGFGALNYRPWRQWRLGLIANYYRYSGLSFDDLELSVNRVFWGREIGVCWSKSDGRFSLQMGGFSF